MSRTSTSPARVTGRQAHFLLTPFKNNTLVAQEHSLGYTFAMPLQPDDILRERYRIEGQLGKGGMGTVFLGYDITLAIKVAVKENLNLNPESERQFHREARLLAALRHSNLPRVTDHFIVDDRQYLVMDYIEGIDLQERLSKKRPTLDEVLKWADAIADALHFLHTRQPPIIHRDLKPANVKLQNDGKIVLVDFGLAKVFDQSQTSTGARGLTPGFSPPEQYGGQRTDARSDQYALAATLYLLLTNQRPADSFQRLSGKEELTPIRRLQPGVPEHVEAALERALALDQDQRFPDIASFRSALREEGTLQTIRVPLPSPAAAKPKRLRRWIYPSAAVVLIAVVALAFGLSGGFRGLLPAGRTATPSPRPTLEPTATIERVTLTSPAETADPTQEPTPVATQRAPIGIDNVAELSLQTTIQTELDFYISTMGLSIDGRYLAFGQRFDPEGAIMIWDLQEQEWLPSLVFHKSYMTSLTFSPNGNLMASASFDGTVAIWKVGSWELVDSFLTLPQGVASLAFSSDETLLAVGGYRDQVGLWRLADKEPLHHYTGDGSNVSNKVAFTADGSEYYADTGYADIKVWNTADGALLRSYRGEACLGGFDLSSDETRLAYSSACTFRTGTGGYGDPMIEGGPLVPIAVRDVVSGDALVFGASNETSTGVIYTFDDSLILTNAVTIGQVRILHFWNALDGTLVFELPARLGNYAEEFLLSDDGSMLILGDSHGNVLIYGIGL